MSHVSFLKEPSSRDYPPIFTPICSGTISLIPSDTKAESPLLKFTPSPAPQMTCSPSMPSDHQFQTVPAILLLLTPSGTRIAGLNLLLCVFTIVCGLPRPRNAELRVPGRKTSSPAGGCSHSTCRASYFITFSLLTRFTKFAEIPDRFQCICLSASCSTILFYLVRSKVAYSRRILSHVFWFLDNSSTFWDPQV